VLERYSDEARTAVDLAQAEARRLGHGHVGTEHLLLGILTEGHSRAARALITVGVAPSACRQKVAEAVGTAPGPPSKDGDLDLTERARRSLQRAVRLANRQRQDHVEPEHILLSLIQVEGRAGQVLRGLGVDPARVRTVLAETDLATDGPGSAVSAGTALGDGGLSPATATGGAVVDVAPRTARTAKGGRAGRATPTGRGSGSAGRAEVGPAPVCANCGVALDGSLAHRGLASRGEAGDLRAFAIVYCASCGSAIGVTSA
jgi:ATP-dependent Clp protease ATP-binding subunit ClpC